MQSADMITLSGIQYSIGESFPIEDISAEILSEDAITTLQALGLQSFCKTDKELLVHIHEVISSYLNKGRVSPDEIELVIICSHTFLDHSYSDLLEVCQKAGLKNAELMLTYQSRCASLGSVLRMAAGFITSEGIKNIMVVMAEKVINESRGRVLPLNLSVASDGAVGFLVSSTVEEGFKISYACEHFNHAMSHVRPSERFVDYIKLFTKEVKDIASKALKSLNYSTKDFKYFICGNYNLSIIKNYANAAGFPSNQLFIYGLKEHAHIFSCDQIISVKTLAEKGLVSKGDKLFLLGTGDYNWSTVVLETI